MTVLQIIALVWTILSSIGAARAGQKLRGSRADRAYLKKAGLNGPMKIMGDAWVLSDILRLIAFVFFAAMGLVALITDGELGRWILRVDIFGALLMLMIATEIISNARNKIMRYHPGSRSDRRQSEAGSNRRIK